MGSPKVTSSFVMRPEFLEAGERVMASVSDYERMKADAEKWRRVEAYLRREISSKKMQQEADTISNTRMGVLTIQIDTLHRIWWQSEESEAE